MSGLRGGLGGALLLAVALAGGCKSPTLPRTYPARGKVVYKGGQPFKGGSIQFHSADDPILVVAGPIEEDGTFTLSTAKDRDKASGAPEGEYKVTVLRPLSAAPKGGDLPGDHKGTPPIPLPNPVRVEAKDNEFKIELNVPPPRP